MPRPLNEQVIVIVGASSGIGRLAATKLAAAGAKVVLAARNEAALNDLAGEIRRDGGTAHVAVVDVTVWEQVNQVALDTVARFGRIDTWINDAAVALYGTVEDTSIDEFDRIIDVNLNGQFYGIKAALPHMRAQQGGTLICLGSVVSVRAVPYLGAYNASKAGVKELVETLRMELMHDKANIDVTLILPASINTPFFNHARSKLGRLPRPLPPIYHADAVADSIVYAAKNPQRDIYVGGGAWMLALGQRISPALMDRFFLLGGWSFKVQRSDRPEEPVDNLFAPVTEAGRVAGDYSHLAKPSMFTRLVELVPTWQRLLVTSALAGAVAVLLSRREEPTPVQRLRGLPLPGRRESLFERILGGL